MITYPIDFQIQNQDLYLDMPHHLYHQDPCPTPSLSNSIIRDLIDKSPLHAAWKHPKLFNKNKTEITSSMSKGAVLHKLLLDKGNDIAVIFADDYRTKIAKEHKEQAIISNKIPILEKDFQEISHCAESAKIKIKNHPQCQGFFAKGVSEAVIAWKEQDIWCRAMIDRLPENEDYPIFDIKGTDGSASPWEWGQRLIRNYRTQGVFYNRGLQKIKSIPRKQMHFIVIEMYEPFEISVFSMTSELQKIANAEIDHAIQLWNHCLQNNQWEGYPKSMTYIDPPSFLYRQLVDQTTQHVHHTQY